MLRLVHQHTCFSVLNDLSIYYPLYTSSITSLISCQMVHFFVPNSYQYSILIPIIIPSYL